MKFFILLITGFWVGCTAPTAGVQVGKDAFKEALSEKKGNTLLLTMWESGKHCEPKALKAGGQETEIEIVAMDTAKAPGGQDMKLTAWKGADITLVDRKKSNHTNHVAVILEKEKIQTWSEVEAHLWREYRKNWNLPK